MLGTGLGTKKIPVQLELNPKTVPEEQFSALGRCRRNLQKAVEVREGFLEEAPFEAKLAGRVFSCGQEVGTRAPFRERQGKKKKQSCNTEGLGEQEEVRTGSKAEIKPGLEFWPLPTSFLGGGLEEVVSLEGAALWYRISAL